MSETRRVKHRTAASIPLYLQISESISRDIAAGRFTDGSRLPPEREMARQFSTTVRTLRKALSQLEQQGMLERVQGSGNYVRANQHSRSIYSMFRLELPHGGGLPTAELLSVKVLNKPASFPDFGSTKKATRIRRLRYLDDKAIAVEEIWLDKAAGSVVVEELGDSLYRYYQLKLGLWISKAQDQVSVADLPPWTPDAFKVQCTSVCGYVERLSWAQDKSPVEFSRTWFNPVTARYVQRLN